MPPESTPSIRRMRTIVAMVAVCAALLSACGSGQPTTVGTGTARATYAAPDGTSEDVLEDTVQVLRDRLDALGVADATVGRKGDEITVDVPDGDASVLDVVARRAELQFRPVLEAVPDDTAGDDVVTDDQGDDYRLGPAGADGDDIATAEAVESPVGRWSVNLTLSATGIDRFNATAAECFEQRPTCPSRRLAIVADDRVASAPEVQQAQFEADQIQITSDFTEQEARELAALLRGGSLPVPLERVDR